jgi:hypothetical protein
LSAAPLFPQPHQLFLPGLSHPFVAVLPQEAYFWPDGGFSTGRWDARLWRFYPPPLQLFRYVEAVKGDFINAHGKWMRAAFI